MQKFDYERSIVIGHQYNIYVAGLLQSFGVPGVSVPEFTWATTKEEQLDKTKNEKDVLVGNMVLEVKSRNIAFKDADDFRYETIMVDTVHGWESKTVKPFAYVIVSQKTLGMFVIPGSTKDQWFKENYYDPARDLTDQFYLTSKRNCRPFIEMVDILLEYQGARTN